MHYSLLINENYTPTSSEAPVVKRIIRRNASWQQTFQMKEGKKISEKLMTNRGQLPHLCLSSITSQLHTLKLLLFILKRGGGKVYNKIYFFIHSDRNNK